MPDEMLEAAKAYARMGWKAFPLHTMVGDRCSCGKAGCKSAAKHPRTKRGFLDATTDVAQLEKWWRQWPDANIGIATGDGLVVVDVDGAAGAAELKAVVEANQPLPATLVAQTGSGLHFIFTERLGAPALRLAARDNVHVRAAGGYIVAPNSRHRNGRTYQWVKKHPIAELPEWLRQWLSGYEVTKRPVETTLGPLPAYLQQNTYDISNVASIALKSVWSLSEQARLASALSSIPATQHDSWIAVGMALKDLNWLTNEGDIGFDLWVAWSETCPEKFALQVCEDRWRSFKRSGVSVGSIYHMAQQHGWNGGLPPVRSPSASSSPNPGINGTHNSQALPAAFLGAPIFFPDTTNEGKVRATMLNAKVAITALGLECKYDLFHNRMLVAGELISKWNSTELSDHVTTMIRDVIRYKFGFDPNKQNVQDACEALCLGRRFDPVLDYLDSLRWDGRPRLDRWLTTYLQAPDSAYTRAVARLSLIAAVRRARIPGTKFDQIIVLEGLEGKGKSEAVEILAGEDNFSDQSILDVDDRKQQELTEGVWLYEIGELTGMRKADVEHVKAFASRKIDRARPAYGRYMIRQPRRTVFFASTNKDEYLQSDTGNRRFWPVATGHIDLAALRRDRDQIWAETSAREAAGESHMLPEKLWKAASEQQESRMLPETLGDYIEQWLNAPGKFKTDVSVAECLVDNHLIQMKVTDIKHTDQVRVAKTLLRMGFVKYRPGGDGKRPSRYRRIALAAES